MHLLPMFLSNDLSQLAHKLAGCQPTLVGFNAQEWLPAGVGVNNLIRLLPTIQSLPEEYSEDTDFWHLTAAQEQV